MKYTEDAFAILLICSDLAMKHIDKNIKPFTVVQWSNLADLLISNNLRPSDLISINKLENYKILELNDETINRLESLISRSAYLGIELNTLERKGINILTRSDDLYPKILKTKLKKYSPPILYYSGNLSILSNKGIAIVGSRNIDSAAEAFTIDLAKKCALDGINVISGGAKGVDIISEEVANLNGGTCVIVVSSRMDLKIRKQEVRKAIMTNKSIIISPFRPDIRFFSYNAMARNKLIYAFSDIAVAISSDHNKGGTWTGAIECIKESYSKLFVRNEVDIPKGNEILIRDYKAGSITKNLLEVENIYDCLMEQNPKKEIIIQETLF